MRGLRLRPPLPAVPAGSPGTLPQQLREMASKRVDGGFLIEAAAGRIEELETAMRQINAQECECSENHGYDPACPHTLALLALSDLKETP